VGLDQPQCDGPRFFARAYTSNPEGIGKPAWLRDAYRGVTDRIGRPVDAAIREDERYLTCRNRHKIGQCWPYFIGLVFDHVVRLEQTAAEIGPNLVASILGLTIEEVSEDIGQGLLPTIAGTNGTIIDRNALRDQLVEAITKPRRRPSL